MLATVATQAARNSRSAPAVLPEGSPVTAVFVVEHPAMHISSTAAITECFGFTGMMMSV